MFYINPSLTKDTIGALRNFLLTCNHSGQYKREISILSEEHITKKTCQVALSFLDSNSMSALRQNTDSRGEKPPCYIVIMGEKRPHFKIMALKSSENQGGAQGAENTEQVLIVTWTARNAIANHMLSLQGESMQSHTPLLPQRQNNNSISNYSVSLQNQSIQNEDFLQPEREAKETQERSCCQVCLLF